MRIPAGDDMWSCDGDPARAAAIIGGYARLIVAHRGKILAWIGVCFAFALAYGATSRPEFVAVSQVLLEPRVIARDGPEVVREFHQVALDSEQALTEQLAIRSPRVLRYTFDALRLANAPELAVDNDDYLTRMLRRWHAVRGAGAGLETDRQFARFVARVRTRRLASSYNIDITYEAQSARQAVRVVNAVASAYVRDRLIRVAGGVPGGSSYHVSNMAALRAEIASAERAVAAGEVPDAALPDANVRFLGRAVPPLRPVFPRWPPLLALALVLGIVTAALAAAALRDAGQRVRTGQQLANRVGVECLVAIGKGRVAATAGCLDLRPALCCIWARVSARAMAERPMTIGFAAWDGGSGAPALAVELAAVMDRAGLPARQVSSLRAGAGRDGAAPSAAGPGGARVLITVLPPLAHSHDTWTALPDLDAVFLVVEADRTSVADARAGVRLLGGIGDVFAGVILAPAAAA